MQSTYHGGLTGKARSNRLRNRVQRMCAQQMLDEYLDADEFETPKRHVPLRGRAEFLPTIDSWTQEEATFETGNQLQLTLHAVADVTEKQDLSFESDELQLQLEQEAGQLAEKAAAASATTPATAKVAPAPYWARPRITFQPQGGRKVERTFELRRFVYGCALGSAAAAAILLVVSTVVH